VTIHTNTHTHTHTHTQPGKLYKNTHMLMTSVHNSVWRKLPSVKRKEPNIHKMYGYLKYPRIITP